MKKTFLYLIFSVSSLAFFSCEKTLEVTPKSEFAPSIVLTSESGIRSVLFSSYAEQQTQANARFTLNASEVGTDMAYNTGGAENGQYVTIINFTWDPSLPLFFNDMWSPNYRSIRDANIVVENIDQVNTAEATKKLYKAEARVLRAQAYAILFNYFGPVPLRTSSTQIGDLARATEAEMKTFIETEITQSIADLPDPGKEATFGRINKGSANGILAKFYLSTKQWQKAADAAKAVIDLNYYALYPSFEGLFRVENEGMNNKEMLLVLPCITQDPLSNYFQAGALPPAYKSSPQFPNYVYKSTMSNFATQYRLRTAFTNTFAANDKRLQLICTSYVNSSNQTIDLSTGDNARSFKYWDNSTIGNNSATDIPVIRYSDILLTRAEALNELNGPTEESFNLINQVRTRAGIADLTLVDTPTKDDFRTAIFQERGWEFISEGKRREDLIRQGTFISLAQARGVTNATPQRVLFPIPQPEIDANKLCIQNPGY
jgi:hypothetical protein